MKSRPALSLTGLSRILGFRSNHAAETHTQAADPFDPGFYHSLPVYNINPLHGPRVQFRLAGNHFLHPALFFILADYLNFSGGD